MQLLHASPISVPEFVSLSILRKPDSDNVSSITGDPMMMVSPLATTSSSNSLSAVRELHSHLASVLMAANVATKTTQQDRTIVELLREDEKQLEHTQIFRPLCASGIALHFRLIRNDKGQLSSLSTHIMASSKSGAKSGGANSIQGLMGVVFCVGMTGLPMAHSSSSIQHSLPQRVNDCITLLSKVPAKDTSSVKTVLSAFLLTDDEHRKTNAMVEAASVVVLPEADEADKAKSLLSPMGMISPIASVRKLKSSSMNGDLDDEDRGPDIKAGLSVSLNGNSAEAAREMTDRLTVLSVAETESFLRKYATTGQERKANLDLTGAGKSRFRRRKGDARDADFDQFDYKGPVKEFVKKKSLADAPKAASKLQLQQPKRDTRAKVSSIPALSSSRSDGPSRRMSNQFSNDGRNGFDPFKQTGARSSRRRINTPQFVDDDGESHISDARSKASAHDSVDSHARAQVNIALNEDLSCSYEQSQLSSCTVEGVVQAQLKTSARSAGPFFLFMRDPAGHIESMQENKKFVDDISGTLAEDDDEDMDWKYAVSIPKGDSYFPVLRYKCASELRPVPIRVQTRVKVDGRHCRVALQISSNPNNKASLSDLTIIMGVPDILKGDTLVTQPAGGVWNEVKRSVIWCVSELGEGEKFQLQARFELEGHLPYNPAEEKPRFPVMVRCQCLFSQLSDVEIEVSDIPEVFPVEITMKLARRYRLSHRERS